MKLIRFIIPLSFCPAVVLSYALALDPPILILQAMSPSEKNPLNGCVSDAQIKSVVGSSFLRLSLFCYIQALRSAFTD